MATPSPRNFSQYSGLDRFKMQQGMPSALERQQDSLTYGPGSDQDMLLKSQYSWAAPLSERPATASGRSYNDPERIMERRMRDGGGGGGYAPGINVLPKQSGGGNLRRPPRPPRPYSPGSLGVSLGMPQGGLGASLNSQLQQSMGAGAAVIPAGRSLSFGGATKGAGRKMVSLSFGGATKGAGRKMVANAMFPNTKGYFS